VSRSTENLHPDSPLTPVDLWAELERLGRNDRAMLAERRDDVRRSRQARRAGRPQSVGSRNPAPIAGGRTTGLPVATGVTRAATS
jgi:hypothetical protein